MVSYAEKKVRISDFHALANMYIVTVNTNAIIPGFRNIFLYFVEEGLNLSFFTKYEKNTKPKSDITNSIIRYITNFITTGLPRTFITFCENTS